MLAFCSPVTGGTVRPGEILLKVGGDEPMELAAKRVVNSAGLFAQKVAASIDGIPAESIPPGRYAKGNYYSLAGAAPFSRLIYPIPEEGGLGVHLTIDLGHQARFGPDVEWIDTIDYTVDPGRAAKFYEAIRSYWPALPDDALQPGYAGVRPKLAGVAGGHGGGDFVIQAAREHGVNGLVNLYGIESPGLTASLAIADEVIERLTTN
jgi:L-2-hydroxyglutarate oxidase LhgO